MRGAANASRRAVQYLLARALGTPTHGSAMTVSRPHLRSSTLFRAAREPDSLRASRRARELFRGLAGMMIAVLLAPAAARGAQMLPADGARDVSRVLPLQLRFESHAQARAAARAGIELLTPVGSPVPGVLRIRGADVAFEASAPLAACSTYTALVRAEGLRSRFTTSCSSWTPPEQIDDRRSSRRPDRGADDVQLASAGVGGAVAAWFQSNGRRGAIEASSLQPDTGAWGAPRAIDLRDGGGATLPVLAALADGRVMAAWVQDVHGHAAVLARVLGAGAAPQRLDDPALRHGPAQVQLAADASGHAMAVWQQPGPRHGTLWASHWDGRLARWSRPRALDPLGPADYAPVVVGAGDDRFVAAWERGPVGHESIAASRWLQGGWSAPRRLSPAGQRAERPLLALDGDGSTVGAAWIQGDGPARRVALRRLREQDLGGDPPATPQAPGMRGPALSAALVFDPAGNLAAAWEQQAGPEPSSPDVIEATRWMRAAAAPASAARLDPSGQRSAGNPVLVSDPAGNLVCAWYQDGTQGLQVLAARFDASAAHWQPALLLSDTRSTVQASFPALSVDAAGSVTAAWQQFNDWRNIIVASRLP